jgi:tryptophanyl-tRNA synthetase
MSKSLGNDLTIFADENVIYKQVMGIVTDPNRIRKDDPGDPEKNVIFKYLRLMDYDQNKISEYEEKYKAGTVGDVELKEEFYIFFLKYFKEFRAKRAELAKDKDNIIRIMKENGLKANKVAGETMAKVRKSIGAIY